MEDFQDRKKKVLRTLLRTYLQVLRTFSFSESEILFDFDADMRSYFSSNFNFWGALRA
jgi:hypothetical protein